MSQKQKATNKKKTLSRLLRVNLNLLKEIETWKKVARSFEKELNEAKNRYEDSINHKKTLEEKTIKLEEENRRLREKILKQQSQANGFRQPQPTATPGCSREAKAPNASRNRQPAAERERDQGQENQEQDPEPVSPVSVDDFMTRIIRSDPAFDNVEINGPWDNFISPDSYLEIDDSLFKEHDPRVDMKGYVRIYSIHPQLCPHSHYNRLLSTVSEEFQLRGEDVPEISRSLKPVVREIWIEFPLHDNIVKSLAESFQGKLSETDIKQLINTVIPMPELIRRDERTRYEHSGALQATSRTALPIYIPDDTIFCGVVFGELDVDEAAQDDDPIDYYPGIAPNLEFSDYRIQDLKVPHYNVEFCNGDVEEVLLSDLIPLEAVTPGTVLIWRTKDGEELVVYESFEKRSDLMRPPLSAFFVRAQHGHTVRTIPLSKICMNCNVGFCLLKKIRLKLLGRNKTRLQQDNILPEGTKRKRKERLTAPAKPPKKPRILGKKKTPEMIGENPRPRKGRKL